MYLPTFQGLSAADVLRGRSGADCYPFDVPHERFFRARNAIYHLFGALRACAPGRGEPKPSGRPLKVLAPDYNSGNEILAMRAAGAAVEYYPIGPDTRLDVEVVARLCERHNPSVLYVIHYLGWPQPMEPLVSLCRERGMLLVEDCALALLSESNGRPLGSFGDYSVFCLYKTLPVPNGAVLVDNHEAKASSHYCHDDPNRRSVGEGGRPRLRRPGSAAVAGRTAELVVQHVRSRIDGFGLALERAKRTLGRAAGAMDVPRASIGDIGFKLKDVDLAMSPLSERLVERCDFDEIRRRRVDHFKRFAAQVDGYVNPLHRELPDGTCPLFYPILVSDKRRTAEALRNRGIAALEFWNYGADPAAYESVTARSLRAHLLALPIHQDLTPAHIDYAARQIRESGACLM